jgi:phage shock protein PspC (stress-responsive transcriptional regulator)
LFQCSFDFFLPAFRLFAEYPVKPFDAFWIGLNKLEHTLSGEAVLFGLFFIEAALTCDELVQRECLRLRDVYSKVLVCQWVMIRERQTHEMQLLRGHAQLFEMSGGFVGLCAGIGEKLDLEQRMIKLVQA